MDFRTSARRRLAIELATHERKPLAHSGQSKAPAAAGSLLCGFDVKPRAIVPHDEVKRMRRKVQLDMNSPRLRVPRRVRQGLLGDAETGGLDFSAEPFQARIGEKGSSKAGALRLLIQVRAQSRHEPQIVQERRSQIERKPARLVEQADDNGDAFIESPRAIGWILKAPRALQVNFYRRESLAHLVVQLARHMPLFIFLHLEKTARKNVELFVYHL